MAVPTVSGLMDEIIGAAQGVIEGDLPTLEGFAKEQLEDLAELGVVIAKGAVPGGWIDDEEELKFWLKGLRRLAGDFVHTLAALVVLVVEKVINAVLDVLRNAISTAIGSVVPL